MVNRMSQDPLVPIYQELTKIRKLLELLAKDSIKGELERITTTDERKKVWALCDGNNTTSEIAQKVTISLRAVQIALKELQEAGLITTGRRGYPKRAYDYVPPGWEIRV